MDATNIILQKALWFNPIGAHVSTTLLATAVTLTPPNGADKIMMQCAAQDVRYRLDGTNPTTATGFTLAKDLVPVIIPIDDDTDIRVIEEASTAVFAYQWGGSS